MMREFVRHPVEVAVGVSVEAPTGTPVTALLLNVSAGGLTLSVNKSMVIGTSVTLSMPHVGPHYHATGRVVWCSDETQGYRVGVRFIEADEEFKARMIAQFCHIESYKKRMMEKEGRDLSSEEAAREWIHQYAADFAEACPQQ